MAAHKIAESARAVELVRAGHSYRSAARLAGVSATSCFDACQRVGVVSLREWGKGRQHQERTKLP